MCIKLFAATRNTPSVEFVPMFPDAPAFSTERRASECFRQPSNVELVSATHAVPFPIGADARNA